MKKLSILEIGNTDNFNDIEVIEQTIQLAQRADKLGYSRFWISEHHGGGVAWRSPDILLSILAGYTDNISIGSGGVLLPLNSPLRIAQNYKLLATLYPGRIDLGIARGSTLNYIADELLNGALLNEMLEKHSSRVSKTIQYVKEEISYFSEKESIIHVPLGGQIPEIWLLGSSGVTMDLAIKEKSNYSLSLMHPIKDQGCNLSQLFSDFSHKYYKSNESVLKSNVAVGVACGRDKKEQNEIFNYHKDAVLKINVSGDFNKCRDEIEMIFEQYKVDEVMLCFFSSNYENKEYCYDKFAEIFELKNRK